ncbi:conserved exported hypothetical protein [Candidatus Sulfopaludibacter sp. SbA4]|nr:conserved exported hypothetical protein [Candidatus Sulfopaludibacter sp. SbA4]
MRNRNHSALAVVAVAACGMAVAQTAPPAADEKPASVSGVVTNSVTGEPLLRAHVTLRGGFNPSNQTPQTYGAMTGAEGKFSITALRPGSYSVSAERIGFEMAAFPDGGTTTQVTVKSGDTKDDLKLKLVPDGAIAGRVVDADGEPMEAVSVTVDTGGFGGGQGTITDDQGHFRIGGLRPGKYRIKATPTNLPIPAEIRTDGTVEVHYAATYYPRSLDGKGATKINVAAGGEVTDADIKSIRTPIVRVSGTVTGIPQGSRNVSLMVQQGSGISSGTQVKPDGTFELWRLDPGKHTLSATWRNAGQALQTAPLEIDVAGSNIDHVELRMVAPSDISGIVQFEDEQAKPQARPQQQGQGGQQSEPPKPPQRLFLRPPSGFLSGGQQQAEIAADGSFTLRQIQPGRYQVTLSWNNAYVKSLRLGQAGMEGRTLDLRNGSAGAALTVLVSSGVAEVSGTVRNGDDPAGGKLVALVPDPADGTRPFTARSGPDGAYRFSGIAPGRYKLAVIDDADQGAAMSDAGLDDYEDALEISIGAGEKLAKDLKVRAGEGK